MSRLWDKGEALDDRVARFTVGRDPQLDRQIVAYDALASAAHATMLARIGVISADELSVLVAELSAIARDAAAGCFEITPDEEDCHTAIENRLTQKLGDSGRRIHTGRSRNDQVIAALRLWGRERLLELGRQLGDLAACLIDLAEQQRETALPGYTHTRQAMPSTLGHLFGAYAELLLDSQPWLETAFGQLDRSPLGSASGYGVALPLDRSLVAELLRFGQLQRNTLAVQNDRGRTEMAVLSALGLPLADLGRLATDLIWFSCEELGFVRLSPQVTTGSSIMPQKRNPDLLELIRAGAARMPHLQGEIVAIYGRLTAGYHRDLQLTKAPFIEGLQLAGDLFDAMTVALQNLTVDVERCRAALVPSIGATDEVYRRVAAGAPFRRAYREVAADPEGAVEGQVSELWRGRRHIGAPGNLDLSPARGALEGLRQWLSETRQRVVGAWSLLELDRHV
jgi:argininosuccinate lyase